MIFKNGEPKGDLNGFLDAGSHVQGELRFEHTFRLDGKISGRVVSDGTLIVGEAGHLDGEAEVAQVFVSGKVEGRITASRRIQVAAKGKVFADLETPSLVLEDGALFEGRCSMSQRASRAQAASSPPPKADDASDDRGGKVARLRMQDGPRRTG